MNVFIVYHSQTGLTHTLAKAIAEGVKKSSGAHVFLRRIPDYSGEKEATGKRFYGFPDEKDGAVHAGIVREYQSVPEYSLEELKTADALVVGSPVYYANMSAATKIFFESLTPLWTEGSLENKPGGAFVTSGTLHGGKEQAMMSILSSLMTFSMVPVGLPLRATYMHAHGSIFGPTATHVLTPESKSLAELFGKRIADIAFAFAYGKKVEGLEGEK